MTAVLDKRTRKCLSQEKKGQHCLIWSVLIKDNIVVGEVDAVNLLLELCCSMWP